jgi:hypothetical protein
LEASDERREMLFAKLTESGGRLRVRNALNPILWLSGLIAVPCFAVLLWNPTPHFIVPVILAVVVGTAVLGFLFLLVFDRDRLHSEEYLIKNRTLDLIEDKGSRKAIDAATVTAISQADFLALPDSTEGQE